ncbi:MAG: ADP-ribose diphosphatase [Gammaproteobacteria bacterium]|nr:MAG: ADP-ribose diphosphatase [Gammaproteobacteria bacterium]
MDLDDGPCFGRNDVKVLEKKEVYKGFFRVNKYRLKHRMIEGGWTQELERECFDRPQAVGVLLYDPFQDNVVILEQFRIGSLDASEGPWQMELVAGLVEQGETCEGVARREAIEEAGAEILNLEYMYEYYSSPGGCNEKLTLYCGVVDSTGLGGVHGLKEEGEDIWVQVMPRAEAWTALEENYIGNAATIISLQWLQIHYQRLQEQWR